MKAMCVHLPFLARALFVSLLIPVARVSSAAREIMLVAGPDLPVRR
jgi:hypothetical protein